jgi:cytochrome c-type biogenesis protein CcmH
MKRLLTIFSLVLVVTAVHGREASLLAEDPVVEQRLIAISEELRCLVCQNESLAGSRADLALDLRRELRTLIKQGKSDEEIKEFMVSRYGDFVLYRPPVKPITWVLWLGPFVLMVAGIVMLMLYLRRRKQALTPELLSEEEIKQAQALLQKGQS